MKFSCLFTFLVCASCAAQYPTWDLNLTGIYTNATTGRVLATSFANIEGSHETIDVLCTIVPPPTAGPPTSSSVPRPPGFGAWINDRVYWAVGSYIYSFGLPAAFGTNDATSLCPRLTRDVLAPSLGGGGAAIAIAGLALGPPGQLLVLSSTGVVYSAPASSPSNITRVATLPVDNSIRIPFTFDGSVLWALVPSSSGVGKTGRRGSADWRTTMSLLAANVSSGATTTHGEVSCDSARRTSPPPSPSHSPPPGVVLRLFMGDDVHRFYGWAVQDGGYFALVGIDNSNQCQEVLSTGSGGKLVAADADGRGSVAALTAEGLVVVDDLTNRPDDLHVPVYGFEAAQFSAVMYQQ
jgi:hypothetical protein